VRRAAALVGLAALVPLASCDLSMTRQPRYETFRGEAFWPGGPKAQAVPAEAVAVDAPVNPDPAAARPQMSAALLARGRARYAIYCTPCHGVFGEGDGRIVQRGFPKPPSYADPRLEALSAEQIVGVISNGYGVMYGYGDRLPVGDRWAVAAYVRALQAAHGTGGGAGS
jgi:mono/diheme cytochrome c family protein